MMIGLPNETRPEAEGSVSEWEQGKKQSKAFEGPQLDAGTIVNALAEPIFVVDNAGCVCFANLAAEQFLATSASALLGRPLAEILPPDSPVFSLVEHVRVGGQSVSEYGVTIETPKIGSHFVSVEVSAVSDYPGAVAVSIQERSIARKIDHQLVHRNAARSVTAMAAMLAHEVKNPLSGIRGAAQLVEQNAGPEDRELTQLICDETDRIVALVQRMEMFSDERPLERDAVNIHEVLGHVRLLAQSGFARDVRFVETYDPSLPPVYGNRDQLIQVLLNLVKNAAEAVPKDEGEIILSTRFQQGVRLTVPGSRARVELPLTVSVTDNGGGIPEDLKAHLFDPFVSAKAGGTGLGLALVAKIIGDHGGVIELQSAPRKTVFQMMLPKAPKEIRA
ncbi:nitrogen regulation protein NR(II) [Pelagibius sp. Alg239-R121]|uniref:two-component system sensor histidine kinase NtrB n=1 Tax=Pelagibius sp. Alg239-R121 TaxID=2993448 RepID=UPI0024A6DA4B|nr:ATP-binding protein [Pelagibius sp. Alg239-R121]